MAIRIPYEYQEVEYIESSGTQYIDTGVAGKSGVEINADIMWLDSITTSSDQSAIGARNGNVRIYPIDLDGGYWSLGYNSNNRASTQPSANVKYSVYSKLAVGSQVLKVNGTTLLNLKNTSSYDTGLNLWMPTTNYDGGAQTGKVRIYGMTISVDGTLVREFVPCYRETDNIVGMYDRANDIFYENAGTGTFSMGKAINFVDRKFQEGTVGSTNVIEGMTIPVLGKYEQLVNYTMLYDGSLGDATLNQHEEITEGFAYTTWSASGSSPTLTKNTSNLYASYYSTTANSANIGVRPNKAIDFTGYSMVVADCLAYDTYYVANYPNYEGVRAFDLSSSSASVTGDTQIGNHLDYGIFKSVSVRHIERIDISGVASGYPLVLTRACMSKTSHLYIYNMFLVKADDWSTLANKAGITASSIDDILTASSVLLANKDAVNFMIAQCTGDFMASAIQNSTFLTALETSPYKTLIQSNEHWSKFLAMVA